MQKFKAKLKNSPTGAPQACSSENTPLNRDKSLSEASKVLTLNILEVGTHQHKDGQNLRVSVKVYVLNISGEPLMPCSPRKARLLLKKGEAKVVQTNPFFVIQLKKATGEQKQECSLGIDSGSKFVGFSVITEKKEIVTGELNLDQKTSDRIAERKRYRVNRRNKLWYRKPRFNNRTKQIGWLPPSTMRKFNTHITLINKLKKILPIKEVHIEIGNFDIQKIENPDIKGIEYQQGSMLDYQNMRSFLMSRENGKCQICNLEFSRGNPPHIHHIIPRSKGGTDREKNLALLHEKCHKKLHKDKSFNLLKKNSTYKDAAFMNRVKNKYKIVLPDCITSFGYETFVKRNELGLEKTHYNDAFVIAGGTNQIKTSPIILKQKHRNSRVLQVSRKGFKPSYRRKRYSIQPYDIITVKSKRYIVKGCHSYGGAVICTDGIKNFDFRTRKVEKVLHTKSIFV
jgi:hypothetical protein